jgi:hypothetical protein
MTRLLAVDVVQASGLALIQFDHDFFPKFWSLVEPSITRAPQGVSNQSSAAKVEIRAEPEALKDVVAALSRLIDRGCDHTFHDFPLASLVREWAPLDESEQAARLL